MSDEKPNKHGAIASDTKTGYKKKRPLTGWLMWEMMHIIVVVVPELQMQGVFSHGYAEATPR